MPLDPRHVFFNIASRLTGFFTSKIPKSSNLKNLGRRGSHQYKLPYLFCLLTPRSVLRYQVSVLYHAGKNSTVPG